MAESIQIDLQLLDDLMMDGAPTTLVNDQILVIKTRLKQAIITACDPTTPNAVVKEYLFGPEIELLPVVEHWSDED